tara:strand:- start:11505 stop:12263 length:759 start_codon:yes stop_codon:yes gene_type:complete
LKKKITILTPTHNSAKTILANLRSVKNQKYNNWEHIIIDNKSNDNTLDLIKANANNKIKVISEKDKGIYDAINKGIQLAKGEIISILHSDDVYFNKNTLQKVIKVFKNQDVGIIYGNLLYVSKEDTNKVIRYWKSSDFNKGIFSKGWSPPHPTFFVKKKIYNKYGKYKVNIGNPADIELMYRFLELKEIKSKYVNEILIKMRYGGKSNNSIIQIFIQNLQILKILNLKNPFKMLKFIYFKIIERTLQFIKKK